MIEFKTMKKMEGEIMKRTMLSGLSLIILFCLIVFQVPNDSYGAPKPYVSPGSPQVVVVSGTNYEMGVQFGEQTAAGTYHNVALFKSRAYEAYGKTTVINDVKVWDYFTRKHDPGLVDWLKGIVKGCKNKKYYITYDDIVLLMVYPSEMMGRPSLPYPKETAATAKLKKALKTQLKPGYKAPESAIKEPHSCNAFGATRTATSDGNPVVTIDQMLGEENMDTVILVAFPKNGSRWVSQPYSGRVNGNSGMNGDGLAWSMTAIMTDPADYPTPWGLAPEVYFHYLCQNVKSPAEAKAYLDSTPRSSVAGGFTIGDAAGNLSVYECNPFACAERTPGEYGETDFTVQTNHLVNASMEIYNPFWIEFMGTVPRYDTVFQFIAESLSFVDFPFAKSMFASDDWYEKEVGCLWHNNDPGSPFVSRSHGTLNVSIYYPADLTAYLLTGTPGGNGMPAYATGEYVKIKLAETPNAVTKQAGDDALKFYWAAADLLQRELNAEAPYLTYEIAESLREKLNEAFVAFSIGMDREAYADLEEWNVNEKLALYAEALTSYAKAQLYAQMVTTQINKMQP